MSPILCFQFLKLCLQTMSSVHKLSLAQIAMQCDTLQQAALKTYTSVRVRSGEPILNADLREIQVGNIQIFHIPYVFATLRCVLHQDFFTLLWTTFQSSA